MPPRTKENHSRNRARRWFAFEGRDSVEVVKDVDVLDAPTLDSAIFCEVEQNGRNEVENSGLIQLNNTGTSVDLDRGVL